MPNRIKHELPAAPAPPLPVQRAAGKRATKPPARLGATAVPHVVYRKPPAVMAADSAAAFAQQEASATPFFESDYFTETVEIPAVGLPPGERAIVRCGPGLSLEQRRAMLPLLETLFPGDPAEWKLCAARARARAPAHSDVVRRVRVRSRPRVRSRAQPLAPLPPFIQSSHLHKEGLGAFKNVPVALEIIRDHCKDTWFSAGYQTDQLQAVGRRPVTLTIEEGAHQDRMTGKGTYRALWDRGKSDPHPTNPRPDPTRPAADMRPDLRPDQHPTSTRPMRPA
ncbi:MAG: hypothetical protein J3K34DRAFT_526963 [Monoraphidium minutum]|nr:MAG: hypothetical protein J3K34DRAFT_526963 [Monoraphidium minutum]